MCASDQATGQLRTAIVRRLLVLWEGVSKVRIIWGPAAVSALIHAMCSAACSERTETLARVRLGTSLLRALNKLSVVHSIGLICSRPEPDPPMRKLALEAGDRLLQEWAECDAQDQERKMALLEAAGRIAIGPAVCSGADDQTGTPQWRLRRRVLQALYRALRDTPAAARNVLVRMRDSDALPLEDKREIDERLGKALGLARMGQ
jgi:hypothetical protein